MLPAPAAVSGANCDTSTQRRQQQVRHHPFSVTQVRRQGTNVTRRVRQRIQNEREYARHGPAERGARAIWLRRILRDRNYDASGEIEMNSEGLAGLAAARDIGDVESPSGRSQQMRRLIEAARSKPRRAIGGRPHSPTADRSRTDSRATGKTEA